MFIRVKVFGRSTLVNVDHIVRVSTTGPTSSYATTMLLSDGKTIDVNETVDEIEDMINATTIDLHEVARHLVELRERLGG